SSLSLPSQPLNNNVHTFAITSIAGSTRPKTFPLKYRHANNSKEDLKICHYIWTQVATPERHLHSPSRPSMEAKVQEMNENINRWIR
ncbi:hypothetical protein PFISCL1PPCAC_21446, partial [Pristionchus fissidentatus]